MVERASLSLSELLDLAKHAHGLLPSRYVELEKLRRVAFNVPYRYRVRRRDHESPPLALVGPDMLSLFVVALMACGEGIEQIGIGGIAGACLDAG